MDSYLVTALCAGSIAGCGGQRVHLSERLHVDPSVKWIFDAGTELALDFWLFPKVKSGWVSGVACSEGHVIVLCSLGGATEVLMPSHGYVLDMEDGRVLKDIRGPAPTSWDDWAIIPPLAYCLAYPGGPGNSKEEWFAFDFDRERVISGLAKPTGSALPRPPKLCYEEYEYDNATRLVRLRSDLGRGRTLIITAKPRDWTIFQLETAGVNGKTCTRELCRFPSRLVGSGRAYLVINDEDKLLFSWECYLICVAPGAQPEK